MAKADKGKNERAINETAQKNEFTANQGIDESKSRVNLLTGRSDAERAAINTGYGNMANNKVNYLDNFGNPVSSAGSGGGSSGGSGGESSSGGGGTPNPLGEPEYLSVFRDLMGKSGGFDPTRMANIESSSAKLRNTGGDFTATDAAIGKLGNTRGNFGATDSATGKLANTAGNFGATDKSITGLQDFASTGGVNAEDLARINRPLYEEFEKTGGYSQGDIANVRSRSNSGISSFYENLKDDMNRRQQASGSFNPGGGTNFKLARQAAQDSGTNARDTEIGLSDTIRQGRMGAADKISSNQLALQPIKSQNTLQGYRDAGQLDINKQGQISDDTYRSGSLDLSKQGQISSDLRNSGDLELGKRGQISSDLGRSADIDLGLQGTINQSRLGGSSAMSQDANQKASIAASSAAAGASRNDANSRWAGEMAQRDRYEGNSGLLNTYQARPEELLANQDQLFDYRKLGGDWGLASNDQRMTNSANDYGSRLGTAFDKGTNLIGALAQYGKRG